MQTDYLTPMAFLHRQIEEINNYPDKSVFYQNPQIYDGWLALVRAIENIQINEKIERNKKWEERTESYIEYLLTMRQLHIKYIELYKDYYGNLKRLFDFYGDWLVGDCIEGESGLALVVGEYGGEIDADIDMTKFVEEVNRDSLKARSAQFSILAKVLQVLVAVMNRGGKIVNELNPSIDNFAQAIDDDLREWTNSFGKDMLRKMREDLNRNYKEHRTDPYTPELWDEMLQADEEALKLAKRQELSICKDVKQEHWGEDLAKCMDDNGRLMQQILSLCHTEELFDSRDANNVIPFVGLLNPNNLEVFYEIIVRRSLIQCEMFPKLKEQHEEWLNNANEQPEENNDTRMDSARQSKLDEIIRILQKGNWKQPATASNVELLLNTVFGKDVSLLDEGDATECKKMWALVEGGGGERMVIVPANLAGFFAEENLLAGSPKEISTALFGNGNQVNNINKGNSNRCSTAFTMIISFLKKYIDKIIRQV